MTWYYREGDQEVGPIGKKDLQQLINTKRINGQTLVRSADMNQWQTLAQMVHGRAPEPTNPAPPPPPAPARFQAEPMDSGADETLAVTLCSQCGRSFPIDMVVNFGDKAICAACKPMFVQKLKEGAAVQGALRYAGFWIRFGAKAIDGLIMAILQWVIILPLGMLAFSTMQANPGEAAFATGSLVLVGVQQLISIGIPAIYNTFFIGRFGATLGKMACGLKVVTPEGGKVSYLRALGRNFAEWISAIVLGIGYLMAAFDDEKRALHDRVCSTRVIRK